MEDGKHIKTILYFLLKYDLIFLLIVILLSSCELAGIKLIFISPQLENPGLTYVPGEKEIIGWQLEKNNNFSIQKRRINSSDKPFISSQKPGEILYSQSILLDSGDYYLKAKYDVNVTEGSFFIKTDHDNEIEVYSDESICLRTVFVIPVKKTQHYKIQFGFKNGSIGNALIDTIMLIKKEYRTVAKKTTEEKALLIKDNLSLSLHQDEMLDQNVDQMAKSINSAFLLKKEQTSKPSILTYSSPIFNDKYTSFLAMYINDKNVRNSYCQKSSLSLDELLRLYQIPTRQIHWQKNCSGYHQFLEYFNKYDDKWKIIDPFYGIRYIDQDGNYLNFEEIERLVRNNSFSKSNIRQIDIGHLYYNEAEILEGWINSDLAVRVINK